MVDERRRAARVERRVGDRGPSGFVARAVEHEPERDLLDEYLRDLDATFGAVPPSMIESIDDVWPSSIVGSVGSVVVGEG